ncbi:hydrocephalus-inducing protein-like [Schistocerca gregaria]|uniref:hydrocephalus-inducing protein-like n=1 Tax=Schistocerca gregaria TaxID=7010 RepID=UPI00211EAB3F|nr:hydrocephalus-inducing protein-like [Schistocerca gregaria]
MTGNGVVERRMEKTVRKLIGDKVDCPFSVEPRTGRVQAGGAMEFCVAFQSQTVGDFCKLLTVNYETGESVHIKLHGTAGEANVYLEKNQIVIGDTFMGLKRESSFLIFNKTKHIVNFRWKRLPDPAHDNVEIERLKESFEMVKDLEMKKNVPIKQLCHVERNQHEIVCDRIYSDEIEALKQQELDFKDRNFILLPGFGEIWPDNWIEITVIFMPDKAQNFCVKAYCDILGAEHRIPLTITGVGQGPLLRLNVRSLDAGYIVAQAVHSYEIVVTNSGDIPGTVKFMPSCLSFGGKICCDPKKLHLNPDDYKTFLITFNSNTVGNFEENVKFLIEESHEVLQFMLK